jgi:hypothetical protein
MVKFSRSQFTNYISSSRKRSMPLAVLFVVFFGMAGYFIFSELHAATAVTAVEAENGVLSAGATKISDAAASNGAAILFSAPAPVTTPPATSTSPSGEAMPVGNTPGWNQVFTDDFTTNVPLGGFKTAYGAKWSDYGDPSLDSAGKTGVNSRYSTSKTVSVKNNVLNVNMHYENGFFYGDALLPMKNGARLSMQYGKIITRFRVVNPVHGYKTAWLLWPDSNTWADGEIDFPEGNLDGTIKGFSHCVGNPSSNCLAVDSGKTYTTWHTAIMEWTPGKVSFTLDGTLLKSTTTSVAAKPMHYVLQSESCFKAASACPTDLTSSSDIQLDWISIYSPAP